MKAYATDVRVTIVTWADTAAEARERVSYVYGLIRADYEGGGVTAGDNLDPDGIAAVAGWVPGGRTVRLPERDRKEGGGAVR